MDDYAWRSFFYDGKHDWATRYWLPRILEVFSKIPPDDQEEASLPLVCDIDWIIDQMNKACWHTWREQERQAVRGWFDAWWRACLAFRASDEFAPYAQHANRRAHLCLASMKEAGLGLDEPLSMWREDTTTSAVQQLVSFILEFSRDDLLQGVFGLTREDDRLVADWVLSHETDQYLEKAYNVLLAEAMSQGGSALDEADDAADHIDEAVSMLTALRSAEW